MPSYTISLDEIDLSLIPIFSQQRRDSTVPIWSPVASGAEYYELQVLAEEGSSNDETLENASTHVCPICEVDVCLSYWHRHTTSAVHQANQAIAQTSLSRVKQMALAAPVAPPPARTTTYFCPPCSSAVALSKRTTHKQTEQHSAAVLHQKLLQCLAKLYESKDNLKPVCEDVVRAICDYQTISEDFKSRLLLESEILPKKDRNQKVYEDYVKNYDDELLQQEVPLENNLKQETNKINKNNNDEEFIDVESLEHEVSLSKHHKKEFEYDEIPQKNTKKIENNNEGENSNSFVNEASNMEPNNKEQAAKTADKPQLQRKKSDEIKTSANPVRNYVENGLCLVCKVTIPHTTSNIIKHLKGKEHNEKLKLLKSSTKEIRPVAADLQEKHNVSGNSNSHINGNTSTQVKNQTIAPNNTKNIDIHIKQGKCVLCNVKITDNISNIKEHVNGRNHRYLQSLATNEPILTNAQNSNRTTDTAGGSTSKIGKTETQIVKNITSGAQVKQLANEVDSYVRNGYCNLCRMKIPKNDSNIKEHVNGWNHKGNLKILVSKPDQSNSANNVINIKHANDTIRKQRTFFANTKKS